MGNPASDLFNDAALNPQWTVNNPGGLATIVEEGPAASGQLKVVFGGGGALYTNGAGIQRVMSGDFDIAVVLSPLASPTDTFVAVGVYALADALSYYVLRMYVNGTGNLIVSEGGNAGGSSPWAVSRVGGEFRSERQAIRISRYGALTKIWYWWNDAWVYLPPGGGYTQTVADLVFEVAGVDVNVPHGGFFVRGILALPLDGSGVLPAPAAPTGGVALSTEIAGDRGVTFLWDAPPANVARTVEFRLATDALFTVGLEAPGVDSLKAGARPQIRYGGVAPGTTVYAGARYRNELGVAGPWSASVSEVASAAAALAPGSALRRNVEVWLQGQAALATVLGGTGDALRMYYGSAPPGATKPYVVWNLGAGEDHQHMGGVSQIENPSLVTDVFANDGTSLETVVDVLESLLQGYRGLMGVRHVRRVFRPSGWQDLPVLRADGSQKATLGSRAEWTVWFVPGA